MRLRRTRQSDGLYGRGRHHRDFLIVTIGAGIGAAIVTNDVVYRGAHGDAGELGHTPVDPNGPECVCGNRGCLEAIIGDRALVSAALHQGVLTADETICDLHTAADRRDRAAQAILRNAGEILGRSVAGLVNIVDPETVAIYGEGTTGWQHWRPASNPHCAPTCPPSATTSPSKWTARTTRPGHKEPQRWSWQHRSTPREPPENRASRSAPG